MYSVYSIIAQLCELRDSILLSRIKPESFDLPGFDPLKDYSISIALRSDVDLASYHVEIVAVFSSGGGEESSYSMEKRAAIYLNSKDNIKIRCSCELDVFEESYTLDESGSSACMKKLHEFFA